MAIAAIEQSIISASYWLCSGGGGAVFLAGLREIAIASHQLASRFPVCLSPVCEFDQFGVGAGLVLGFGACSSLVGLVPTPPQPRPFASSLVVAETKKGRTTEGEVFDISAVPSKKILFSTVCFTTLSPGH